MSVPALILYLHGFRSSPQSFKARLIGERLRQLGQGDLYACPQLPTSPRDAVALADKLIAGHDPARVALIGSSLGGYYARWLAERHGCRAALLNPATRPFDDLQRYLGEQPLWHGGGSIVVEPVHLEELRALDVRSITLPQRYYLLAASGDEVLDYRDMLAAFPGTQTRVIEGGDHGISDFAVHLDAVLDFCGVAIR